MCVLCNEKMLSKFILRQEAYSYFDFNMAVFSWLENAIKWPHSPNTLTWRNSTLCSYCSFLYTHSCTGCKLSSFYKFLISIQGGSSHLRKPWERKGFTWDNWIHLLNLIWWTVKRWLFYFSVRVSSFSQGVWFEYYWGSQWHFRDT